ncbi:MAG TPA: UbiA family prenyltransferase [Chloroflexota bacterium]|nr:UbiA family prenyltransferase [Chloroflexota bacterium]
MRRHNWRIKALAHLEMTRPYTLFHPGLLAIAGAEISSGGHVAAGRVALAALVTMCGWEAGLYAGDYYDRSIDALSKPSRPIPSGRVSAREAFLTMVGLILAGYAGALLLGVANLALAVATTALGIAYAKAFKSRALLGNVDRGVLGLCAVLFGALAGGGVLAPAVALLAALVFCHDAATNLVGAVRDIEGDRAAGCPTVPVVYGVPRALAIAGGLALGSAALGCALMLRLRPAAPALALFALAGGIAAAVYLTLWLRRAAIGRPAVLGAHKYLIVERLVLMSAFIAVYAPLPVALGLLGATLVASIGAQWLLRDRYEQQQILRPAMGSR